MLTTDVVITFAGAEELAYAIIVSFVVIAIIGIGIFLLKKYRVVP